MDSNILRIRFSGRLCRELLGLQPRQGPATGGSSLGKDERVKQILDETMEKLPDEFPLAEICSRLEEKTPFMVVIVQECERINRLLNEAKQSLQELDKGLKVRHFLISSLYRLVTVLIFSIHWSLI